MKEMYADLVVESERLNMAVYDDSYVDLEAIRYSADEKLESAMFETRANHNLKEAMRLVNSVIDEIGSYSELNDLKQGHCL